jgi:NAD(P)-dependent dehydrogenase (short-subunit alcohol dehydrogenase family)
LEPRKTEGYWLLFGDDNGLSAKLAQQLRGRGYEAAVAFAGDRFTADGDTYTIRPAQLNDYKALLVALNSQGQTPTHIVHLWNIVPLDKNSSDFTDKALERSFYSLLALAQALAAQGMSNETHLMVVSSCMHQVDSEEVVEPEKATLLGLCKVIPQEMSNIVCRSLDFTLPEVRSEWNAQVVEEIIAEAEANTSDSIVAYRGRHRLVQTYESAPLPAINETIGHKLREKGVYLITGGLGGIGLTLAEHLAQAVHARLVLTGRHRFPPPETWEQWLAAHVPQERTSLQIKTVQALEALGAEVLVVQADVADQEQMAAAVRLANERFGALHGVIHAAGLPGGGVIPLKTEEAATSVLRPKVHGTRVLEAVLRDIPLDFLVLCSSVAALTGGIGQVDYCAANAFLDAFAYADNGRNGRTTIAINWDSWARVGMAVNTARTYVSGDTLASNETGAIPAADELTQPDSDDAILPEEGVEVFRRILFRSRLPQVVVCTRHLPTLLQQTKMLTQERILEEAARLERVRVRHPRPALATDYVKPRNETEQVIASIWSKLLGVEQVGIYDNFFELGGDSVLGIQVVAEMNKELKANMPPVILYERSTVNIIAEGLAPGEKETPILENRRARGERRRARRQIRSQITG